MVKVVEALKSGLDLVDVMIASIGDDAGHQQEMDWLGWVIQVAYELATELAYNNTEGTP